MDSALVATSTLGFISDFKEILGENFQYVLAFAAGILVWMVLKKWVFGGAHRV